MSKFRVASLLLATLVLIGASNSADTFMAHVVRISDGNTISVLGEYGELEVRLRGVDCPEMEQPGGKAAKQFVSDLLKGKDVIVQGEEFVQGFEGDKYGRVLADVILLDGSDLGRRLVAAGHAWWYVRYAQNDRVLQLLERESRKDKRGLWAQGALIAPWDYRKAKSDEAKRASAKSEPAKHKPGEERTFDGIAFVSIPAGSFLTGSPSSELGRDDNEGPVRARISQGFWLSKYEVTQAQYARVMGSNPSHFTGDDRRPVENVNWYDAVSFCEKLSGQSSGICRLPTEVEWEYACRAGTTTRFYTGDSDSDLARAGWYYENSGLTTHTVGEKEPNAWGLYDVHGNVFEWCSDYWGSDSGLDRVIRGGSFHFSAPGCRSANRNRLPATVRFRSTGFRIVREE